MKTLPDHYYARLPGGGLVELPPDLRPASDAEVDVVICRRVADYPANHPYLALGRVLVCTNCRATILRSTTDPHQSRPAICLQCARIEPLPL